MFQQPRFLTGGGEVPSSIVHEDPAESIQGGTTNQHYHLTAAQHAHLLATIANPIYAEPVMTSAGDIITAADGDIVMILKNVPA